MLYVKESRRDTNKRYQVLANVLKNYTITRDFEILEPER